MRSDGLIVPAPAKVNLFLRVLGRRVDGYHELETLIQQVSLADRLEVRGRAQPAGAPGLSLSLRVTGDPALVAGVPTDGSNLALRAAAELAEAGRVRGFADLSLEKAIPPAAGLGGGSADAAAALKALNRLWDLGLERDALVEIGARVGSDVPALLLDVPVLALGRGELVEPVELPATRWGLVLFPFEVRTRDAFGWWDGAPWSAPEGAAGLLAAARAGDIGAVGSLLRNDLEGPVFARHPAVAAAKDHLLAAGAAGAVMCGSGPTVAGLFPEGVSPPPEAVEVWSLAPHDSNVDLRDQNPASLPLD